MKIHLATFGMWELLIILLIVVVIFGAARLPQLGGALGKAIKNFRGSFREEPHEIESETRKIEQETKPQELPAGELYEKYSRAETADKTVENK